MPLIDLQTNLKSLKFGGDRPGKGSSGEPFVTNTDGFDLPVESLGQTSPDLFIRGGGIQTAKSTGNDLVRLTKYFGTQEGASFVAQQNLLSSTGVRIYGGYPKAITAPNRLRLNDGVYTPISTLAAATGVSIGTHPNKQGTDPTGLSVAGRPEYLKLVKGVGIEGVFQFNSIINKKQNRLVNLYNDKISSISGRQDTELFSYLGGPGAVKGSGKTIVKRFTNTSFLTNGDNISRGKDGAISFSTFSHNLLSNADRIGDGGNLLVEDFRKSLPTKPASNISSSPDYKSKNIEQRVNLGDPGKRNVDRSNYTTSTPSGKKGLDRINSLYLYKSDAVAKTSEKPVNDLVKFRIATIDNDNPKLATFAHFRAFINSMSDSNSSQWDEFKYTGRGESFFTYQGMTRSINMNFTVVAQSKPELSIMYQKLNYMLSTLAPDYSDSGFMRGNIHRLTVGGYLYEMPGIITSMNLTIPSDTTWEIGITNTGAFDSDVKELPHRIEVQMAFTPIYKFLPETVKDINGAGSITQRFLSLEDDGDTNNLYENGVI